MRAVTQSAAECVLDLIQVKDAHAQVRGSLKNLLPIPVVFCKHSVLMPAEQS